MTRKLPWSRDYNTGASSSKPVAASCRVKAETKDSDAESKGSHSYPAVTKKTLRRSVTRTRSSSPPQEILQENFMVEGPDEDDQYRMVEDEFLSTAKGFTAHLHAAEYQKLKDTAKSQNAATIREISRPVTDRMTDLVRSKQERKARLGKQRLATRKARQGKHNGSDDDDNDTYRQSTSLHGLMESPRNQVKRLGLPALCAATRAMAGFGRTNSRSDAPPSPTPHLIDAMSAGRLPFKRKRQTLEAESDGEDIDTPVRGDAMVSTKLSHSTSREPTRKPTTISAPTPLSRSASGLAQTKTTVLTTWIQLKAPAQLVQEPTAQPPTQHGRDDGSDSSEDSDLFGIKRHARRQSIDRRRPAPNRKVVKSPADDFIPGF